MNWKLRAMSLDQLKEYGGWAIGLIGVVVSVYFGRQAAKAKAKEKTISWTEVETAAASIANKLRRFGGIPDVIFSPDSRGGIIAKLICDHLGISVPIIVGLCVNVKDEKTGSEFAGYSKIQARVFYHYIPDVIKQYVGKKLLIVDDVVFSGVTLAEIRKHLSQFGFASISTATLLCSHLCIQEQMDSDYYWHETELDDIVFPWIRPL